MIIVLNNFYTKSHSLLTARNVYFFLSFFYFLNTCNIMCMLVDKIKCSLKSLNVTKTCMHK